MPTIVGRHPSVPRPQPPAAPKPNRLTPPSATNPRTTRPSRHHTQPPPDPAATDLAASGDHTGALDLSSPTHIRSIAVLGSDHPYTLACAANLALDLLAVGETDRGVPLRESAADGLARSLGEDHPDTLAAASGRRLSADIEPPPI